METDFARLESALVSEKADRKRLEDLLDKVQEDKRRLGNRVNKLTANGRNQNINGLMQDCGNSSGLAMELPLSCVKSLMSHCVIFHWLTMF